MKINQDSLNGYFTAMTTVKQYLDLLVKVNEEKEDDGIHSMDEVSAEADLLDGILKHIQSIESNYKALLGKKE